MASIRVNIGWRRIKHHWNASAAGLSPVDIFMHNYLIVTLMIGVKLKVEGSITPHTPAWPCLGGTVSISIVTTLFLFFRVNLRTLTDENILTASLVSICLDVNLSKEMWSGTYMPYGEYRFPLRADIMRCVRLTVAFVSCLKGTPRRP